MAIYAEPVAKVVVIDDDTGKLEHHDGTVDGLRTLFNGPELDTRGQEIVTGVNTSREAIYSTNAAWRYLATATYEPRNVMEADAIISLMHRLKGAVNSVKVLLPPRYRHSASAPATPRIAATPAAGAYRITWTGGSADWSPKVGDYMNLNRRLVEIDAVTEHSGRNYTVRFVQAVHLVADGAPTPGDPLGTGGNGNVLEVGVPYMVCRGSGNPPGQAGSNFFMPSTWEWIERLPRG